MARKFGIVMTVTERLRPIYESFGIDLPASNGDETYELPMPATFAIDRHGIIVVAFVDADYTKRMEPSEAIAALRER